MKLVIISPEHDDPRETAVLGALLAAGLERYHVRKPHWLAAQLGTWLRALPTEWRTRLVLHQHHELAATFGLGGYHWRDDGSAPLRPPVNNGFTSRSCHDLIALRNALGYYDSVFFGPVFPSISKPGYTTEVTMQVERGVPTRSLNNEDLNASGRLRQGFGGRTKRVQPTIALTTVERRVPPNELSSLLNSRAVNERRTTVLALGGVTAEGLPQIRALGFDGVAVLGAVWQADDPVAAFCELQDAVYAHAA
jgi:thiamine-phosphate pyrophosphorylase